MTSSIFGQLLGPDIAQDAMIAHLKKWLPTYLSEVDRQRGIEDPEPATAFPRSWQVVPTFDNTLDGQLPAMLIICPGTAGRPDKLGDGSYVVPYTIGVCALVKGPDQITSNDIAKRYGTAIATCVLQKKGLSVSNVEGIEWVGDSYDDVQTVSDRTLSNATVHFNVIFRGVLSEQDGPADPIFSEEGKEPNEDPYEDPTKEYPPWGIIPDAEHIQVTIIPRGDLDTDE